MHTTAEALVGAADDDQALLALALERLGLGRLEHLVAGLAVLARVGHGALGARQLGRGDDLHGVGDLLDVANRLEAALDLTQRGEGGGRSCRSAGWWSSVSVGSSSVCLSVFCWHIPMLAGSFAALHGSSQSAATLHTGPIPSISATGRCSIATTRTPES